MDPELKSLLIDVISSWQVIAVTVALILYFFLFNKAVSSRRSSRPPAGAKPVKAKKAPVPVPEPSDDEGLGLEEKED